MNPTMPHTKLRHILILSPILTHFRRVIRSDFFLLMVSRKTRLESKSISILPRCNMALRDMPSDW